jgi:hypothetical protein
VSILAYSRESLLTTQQLLSAAAAADAMCGRVNLHMASHRGQLAVVSTVCGACAGSSIGAFYHILCSSKYAYSC